MGLVVTAYSQRIRDVRASVVAQSGGGAYTDQPLGHWIVDTKIASPMAAYEKWRANRRSWGIGELSTIVVEVEDAAGNVGLGVSTGGAPACFIVEQHLARFCEGAAPRDVEEIWDQMFRASQQYGRRGLALNAISAIDLAIWDLLGRQRAEPVHALLGGRAHDNLPAYATGPNATFAREQGFIGAKVPLPAAPAEGNAGLQENLDIAERARGDLGDGMWLALDCYMALDVDYTLRLIDALRDCSPAWLEEFLLPDDYWGYREVRRRRSWPITLSTGEHEATRWGFQLLLDYGAADMWQPDVTWVGGMTELLRIAELADTAGIPVVPHGSGPYGTHFSITRPRTEFVEYIVMSPGGDHLVPTFTPLLEGEPLPVQGRISVSDEPGFGLDLTSHVILKRPFAKLAGS